MSLDAILKGMIRPLAYLSIALASGCSAIDIFKTKTCKQTSLCEAVMNKESHNYFHEIISKAKDDLKYESQTVQDPAAYISSLASFLSKEGFTHYKHSTSVSKAIMTKKASQEQLALILSSAAQFSDINAAISRIGDEVYVRFDDKSPIFFDPVNNSFKQINQKMENVSKQTVIELLVQRGDEHYDSHDFAGALTDYTYAKILQPDNMRASFKRGKAFIGLEDYAQAQAESDELIKNYPNVPQGYILRAYVKKQAKDYWGAIKDCTKAISLDFENPEAYRLKAQLGQETGEHFRIIITDISKAIDLDPQNAEAYIIRGSLRKAYGSFDTAQEDFEMYRKLTGKK